jgi:alanine dehydrogenase
VQLANKGWRTALVENAALRPGLNTHEGAITYEAVAAAFDRPWTSVDELIA